MEIKNSFESCSGKSNNPETEQVFREACSLYKKQCSAFNQPLIQNYQEYLNRYHQTTALYRIKQENHRTKLIIYDTEIEKEEEKILDSEELLDVYTCITQLPNGDIFCFSNFECSGVTLIIERNYGVRILPYGASCCFSSVIYFDNNVYCFGGQGKIFKKRQPLSMKFDLNKNRWIMLPPMPIKDNHCSSAIFNGNIFISGFKNPDLLMYSIDINSFSAISCKFPPSRGKILISLEELYLVECNFSGWIYKSEDGYNWSKISYFTIDYAPYQVYWTYNKGGIYITAQNSCEYSYYKFDLNTKKSTLMLHGKKPNPSNDLSDVFY